MTMGVQEEQSLMKDGLLNAIDLVEIQSIQSIQSSDNEYSFKLKAEMNRVQDNGSKIGQTSAQGNEMKK